MRPQTSRAPVPASRWRRGAGRGCPSPLAVGIVVVLAVLALVPTAHADLSFGLPGSGTGQTSSPHGIAVDTSNGDLYVVDTQNNRVDVFESSGAFLFAFGWKVNATTPEEKLQTCTVLTGCEQGASGAGTGQLNSPGGIAVDSTSHEIYVADGPNNRVQKFDSEGHFVLMAGGEVDKTTHADLCTATSHDACGAGKEGIAEGQFQPVFGFAVSVGPSGVLYVADSKKLGTAESEGFNTRIQRFNSSGIETGQIVLPDTVGRLQTLAVDGSGTIYVAGDNTTGAVRRYDPVGKLVSAWGEGGKVDSSFNINTIALDSAGDLFVADGTELNGISAILEYDPTGVQLRVFYGSLQHAAMGLAVYHTASGDVLVTEPEGVQQIAVPPPGPLPLSGCDATVIGNSRATLSCRVNPEDKATEYRFQYVNDVTFQHDVAESGLGHGFDHAEATTLEPIPGPGGSSFSVQSISKQLALGTLAPETTYHFRLLASNADAPAGNAGPESAFTTLGPPEVLRSWATDVGTESARVHAEVNPLLLATTGYFQYVSDATYRADVVALGAGHGFDHASASPNVPGGASPIDFGNGEVVVAGAAQLYPLAPGTTYHYRLAAADPFAPVFGPEHTLRTSGTSGVGVEDCPNQVLRIGASAALPDCRAFELVSPLEKDNGDIRTLPNFTGFSTGLDQSANDGTSFTYSSYRAFTDPQSAPYTNQYLARRDAGRGWVTDDLDPPRGGQFATNELDDEYKAFSPDLSSGWLLQEGEPTLSSCAPVGFSDLYHRANTSGTYEPLSCAAPNLTPGDFTPELEGFSLDGSRAVIRVDDALTYDASGATTSVGSNSRPVFQVYESSIGGELHLVSVLPDGEASDRDSGVGTSLENGPNKYRYQDVTRAVSADGSRVFWSSSNGGAGQIYLRENVGREQSVSGACDEPEKACTIPVSESVTTEPARFQVASEDGTKAIFTIQAGSLEGNLYEFDTSTGQSRLIAEKTVESILGSSADATRVYFASEAASAQAQSEGAIEGRLNVYFDDAGAIRFIGMLASSDLNSPYGNPLQGAAISHTARVSPDGLHLAFMSNSKALSEETSGYDNTDASSGEPDAEVYQYDATANGGLGRLRCVSCDPAGALPNGRVLRYADGYAPNPGTDPWAAASVPRFETDLYQSRYLSDDGSRVYFDSYGDLVRSDTNGKEDVYQWEVAGSGGCTSTSSSYVPSSEGCLTLISSGQSHEDSEFLDASPSGSDVFFTTGESLLAYDPGLVDVYDARVDGGFAPPSSPPAACEGEACQGAPVPPLDTTPASFAFSGPGNPVPILEAPKAKVKPMAKPCRKGAVRKRGRCVTVKRKASTKTKRGVGKSSRIAKRNRRTAR